MSDKTLFFALWPDNRQRDQLRDVINSVARDVEGKAVDRRLWHITVAYIGQVDEKLVPELQDRAARIEVEPIRLGFDRLEFWPRPKLAVLTAPTVPTELQNLVSSLTEELKDLDIVPFERTYRPHITVSRGARPFTTERLAHRARTEWSGFELMESVSGPGGASYRPLKQ